MRLSARCVDRSAKVMLTTQNGQGKTTLARLIVGELVPSSGSVTRHPTMKMKYYTQVSAPIQDRVLMARSTLQISSRSWETRHLWNTLSRKSAKCRRAKPGGFSDHGVFTGRLLVIR